MRALHARVLTSVKGVLEPPLTSDCTAVVVSGGLVSTLYDEPSPVLVITELRGLVFQVERPT